MFGHERVRLASLAVVDIVWAASNDCDLVRIRPVAGADAEVNSLVLDAAQNTYNRSQCRLQR